MECGTDDKRNAQTPNNKVQNSSQRFNSPDNRVTSENDLCVTEYITDSQFESCSASELGTPTPSMHEPLSSEMLIAGICESTSHTKPMAESFKQAKAVDEVDPWKCDLFQNNFENKDDLVNSFSDTTSLQSIEAVETSTCSMRSTMHSISSLPTDTITMNATSFLRSEDSRNNNNVDANRLSALDSEYGNDETITDSAFESHAAFSDSYGVQSTQTSSFEADSTQGNNFDENHYYGLYDIPTISNDLPTNETPNDLPSMGTANEQNVQNYCSIKSERKNKPSSTSYTNYGLHDISTYPQNLISIYETPNKLPSMGNEQNIQDSSSIKSEQKNDLSSCSYTNYGLHEISNYSQNRISNYETPDNPLFVDNEQKLQDLSSIKSEQKNDQSSCSYTNYGLHEISNYSQNRISNYEIPDNPSIVDNEQKLQDFCSIKPVQNDETSNNYTNYGIYDKSNYSQNLISNYETPNILNSMDNEPKQDSTSIKPEEQNSQVFSSYTKEKSPDTGCCGFLNFKSTESCNDSLPETAKSTESSRSISKDTSQESIIEVSKENEHLYDKNGLKITEKSQLVSRSSLEKSLEISLESVRRKSQNSVTESIEKIECNNESKGVESNTCKSNQHSTVCSYEEVQEEKIPNSYVVPGSVVTTSYTDVEEITHKPITSKGRMEQIPFSSKSVTEDNFLTFNHISKMSIPNISDSSNNSDENGLTNSLKIVKEKPPASPLPRSDGWRQRRSPSAGPPPPPLRSSSQGKVPPPLPPPPIEKSVSPPPVPPLPTSFASNLDTPVPPPRHYLLLPINLVNVGPSSPPVVPQRRNSAQLSSSSLQSPHNPYNIFKVSGNRDCVLLKVSSVEDLLLSGEPSRN